MCELVWFFTIILIIYDWTIWNIVYFKGENQERRRVAADFFLLFIKYLTLNVELDTYQSTELYSFKSWLQQQTLCSSNNCYIINKTRKYINSSTNMPHDLIFIFGRLYFVRALVVVVPLNIFSCFVLNITIITRAQGLLLKSWFKWINNLISN